MRHLPLDDLTPFARACERSARKPVPGHPDLESRWEGYLGYQPSSLADDSPGAVLELMYDDVIFKSEQAKGFIPVSR